MQRALVGRQPIYRDNLSFFAYELLWRHPELSEENLAKGDGATADVFLNTFLDIGLEQVVGQNLAFINITRNFFLNDFCSLLPASRVVLEVLEDIEPSEPLIQSIADLTEKGYRIALDDFVYKDHLRPLVELANTVKLDIHTLSWKEVQKQCEILRKFNVKLLAEKVESYPEYQRCRDLGFDYYQGYFFCEPQIVGQRQIPVNRLTALRVVAKLQDSNIRPAEAEEVVNQDLAISYKLLRYVNSSLIALSREIQSVRHAVALVGTRRICDWASIMLLAKVDDKPKELVVTAMIRARMCERLAGAVGAKNTDQFFTVGLFSVLDALLDQPMTKVLEALPLSDTIKAALTEGSGQMGAALQCVRNYERGLWDDVRFENVSTETIRDVYLESIEWARPMTYEIAA